MILRYGLRIRCRKLKDIGLPVGEEVPGASESRVQESFIEEAWSASVLSEKPFMNGEDGLFGEPTRFSAHFARSRRAFL